MGRQASREAGDLAGAFLTGCPDLLSNPAATKQGLGGKDTLRSERWDRAGLRSRATRGRGLQWGGAELAGRRREAGLLRDGC